MISDSKYDQEMVVEEKEDLDVVLERASYFSSRILKGVSIEILAEIGFCEGHM